MKKYFAQVPFALVLLGSSVTLYVVHYAVFRDPHHIFLYLISDVAFLPVDVLIVTIILHQVLERRARKERLYKMNMVIGAFFSEVGTAFLRRCLTFGAAPPTAAPLKVTGHWSRRDFAAARQDLSAAKHELDVTRGDLPALASFLQSQRRFLLALLENPNLLEHESFTDMLWSVFHFTDELSHRTDLSSLAEADARHLGGDAVRAFDGVIGEWLGYMEHLNASYPYLFSLAVRTNPFDETATVEIK